MQYACNLHCAIFIPRELDALFLNVYCNCRPCTGNAFAHFFRRRRIAAFEKSRRFFSLFNFRWRFGLYNFICFYYDVYNRIYVYNRIHIPFVYLEAAAAPSPVALKGKARAATVNSTEPEASLSLGRRVHTVSRSFYTCGKLIAGRVRGLTEVECGAQIGYNADSCPSCGGKVQRFMHSVATSDEQCRFVLPSGAFPNKCRPKFDTRWV